MSGQNRTRSISIVGSGLVGTLWALLLRQRGYEVNLYEKRTDPRRHAEEVGRSINLVITSRGLYGLERAGLVDQVLSFTIPVFGRMMHPKALAKAADVKFQPYGRENECNHSVSRFHLNNYLLDAAEKRGVKLFFSHKLSQIDFSSQILTFACGDEKTSVHYDLLFGADGAGSEVRRELSAHLNDPDQERVEWLEADYKEFVMPPASGGRHVMEKKALHIWPRGTHMLMGLANMDGSFTMTLYLPKRGPVSFENVKTPGQIKNLFETEFADAVPLLPHYIEEFQRNPQGILGTVRCRRWVSGNSAALIGDAAHAIIPFFGQGMNCGFEDCTALLDLLDQYDDDWDHVLSAYEKVRRPNAEAIADMALENWTEMRDRVGDDAFLLRKKVEGWLEEHFPQNYKSRYGMITYTLIPYGLAQQAGLVQDSILKTLCKGISSPLDIPREKAAALLEKELSPFLKQHKIGLNRYVPKTRL